MHVVNAKRLLQYSGSEHPCPITVKEKRIYNIMHNNIMKSDFDNLITSFYRTLHVMPSVNINYKTLLDL